MKAIKIILLFSIFISSLSWAQARRRPGMSVEEAEELAKPVEPSPVVKPKSRSIATDEPEVIRRRPGASSVREKCFTALENGSILNKKSTAYKVLRDGSNHALVKMSGSKVEVYSDKGYVMVNGRRCETGSRTFVTELNEDIQQAIREYNTLPTRSFGSTAIMNQGLDDCKAAFPDLNIQTRATTSSSESGSN